MRAHRFAAGHSTRVTDDTSSDLSPATQEDLRGQFEREAGPLLHGLFGIARRTDTVDRRRGGPASGHDDEGVEILSGLSGRHPVSRRGLFE